MKLRRDCEASRERVFLEGQACEGSEGLFADTLVTLEFEEVGAARTRLALCHEFLPTEESRAGHAMGREGSLERLAERLI